MKTQGLQQIYLVGGAVRDRLLEIKAIDKDYVVVGSTPEKMLALGFIPVGKDFPVYLHPQTKEEYALARIERKFAKGYKGFQFEANPEVTLEEDLSRRDLTINAIAEDSEGHLIDPFDGQSDLQDKMLRHVTEAFTEDPVRVLRIARFKARYGKAWRIHPSTHKLIQDMKDSGELESLIPERVWQETSKALFEASPQLFFQSLDELNVLSIIFPEISALKNVELNVIDNQKMNAFTLVLLLLEQAAKHKHSLETRFALLTQNLGKAALIKASKERDTKYLNDEAVVANFCSRLKVPSKFQALATLLSRHHLLCAKVDSLNAEQLYTLSFEQFNVLKKPEQFLQFLDACECQREVLNITAEQSVGKANYLTKDFGLALLKIIQLIDNKKLVQEAIQMGKQGPNIGAWLRDKQIAEIDLKLQSLMSSTSNN